MQPQEGWLGLDRVELDVEPSPLGEFWVANFIKLSSKELYLLLIVLITSCEVFFTDFIVIRNNFDAY